MEMVALEGSVSMFSKVRTTADSYVVVEES